MSNGNWSHQEEIELAKYLVNRVCDRAKGRIDLECTHNYPRDVYFIGNLRPRRDAPPDETSEQPEHLQDMLNKLAPVAFGAEFLVGLEGGSLEVSISLRWSCYYRVFPTLAQQREYQRREVAAAESSNTDTSPAGAHAQDTREVNEEHEDESTPQEEQDNNVAETESPEISHSANDRRRSRRSQDSLFVRFRKIMCLATGNIIIRGSEQGTLTFDDTDLRRALSGELDRAHQLVLRDPDRVYAEDDADNRIRVSDSALVSEESYKEFRRSLNAEVRPEWRLDVRSEIYAAASSSNPSEHVYAIEFVNASPMSDRSPNTEAYLFDTEATFQFTQGQVLPFELDLAPRGFRYNRHLWGRGINCDIERLSDETMGITYVTRHAPVYRQMRFVTRTDPPALFSDLAQDPMPTLDAILQAMDDYRNVWNVVRHRSVENNITWEQQYGDEYDRDSRKYADEIERFRAGCEIIRTNTDVQLAFRLTNETFRRGPKTEWRLFQIVFLVSQIPSIASLADPHSPNPFEREYVDIIYFPTGGGKTEAYLATIIFNCFFDRLRGKRAGVTAWTRFPLRLLTLQQTQRVADVIGLADLVRREQHDERLSGEEVDQFAVGYFVGAGGSPNEIVNPREYRYASSMDLVTWSRVNDPVARQDWKRVVRCPACRTPTVVIDFDEVRTRLVHKCTREDCPFPQGRLPVYIVDNEIYRYLPSVIVGTIDKLAGLGNQRKFALLFGQIDGRCEQHGYFKGICCQKDCNDANRLRRTARPAISGPSLFVQDELHLIKEGLGTFDAHYETFTQRLQREFGQSYPLKIIASSATIEAFERQVHHLYGRSPDQARVFPSVGPTLGQSFYAETLDHPQRLFVGILPHNKTIFNTILELIELYHREIQILQRLPVAAPSPYGGSLRPGTSSWIQLLDLYSTSLTYFLANRLLNSIRTDLEGDVIPHLEADGLLPLNISELTGSTTTDEVTRILDKLERQARPNSPPDAVLATSMISHGVDVDRLNAMIFYGMPRQFAEYIQASSRVGRGHLGIVFSCLHPVRERDQSHYAYFCKFHEFLGQLVEPVAINRWSNFSINRTLPGLFMAVLLQIIANRSGERNPNKYYMLDFVRGKVSDGSLGPDNFIPILEEAYGVRTATTPGEIVFGEEIRTRVRQYLDWLLSPSAGKRFVSEILIPAPMRSLRDVDEPIPIELDSLGRQWTAQRDNR